MITRYTGSQKNQRRQRRHKKIRGNLSGTAERPRVSVFRSGLHLYAQAIDDVHRTTIAAANDMQLQDGKGTKTEKAVKIGKLLGKNLKDKQITAIVFDRGGYKYHGRVKALAEGIRQAGITF